MKISVVCPFFNESSIIQNAAKGMLDNLKSSDLDWELLVVNDGSTDDSLTIIQEVLQNEERAKVITYSRNQGRGYALITGINAASGDIIVTTEIDLSWGDNIVNEITQKFIDNPHLDVVIASPNRKGGGYKNVPFKRVLVSKLGNVILRNLFTKQVTMNTGMTRGYRKEIIQGMQFDEKGKEFHLEVLLKLSLLGAKIGEVPATLEWKDHKLMAAGSKKRKSSSKTGKLVLSHLNFAVFANPIRYFWTFSAVCFVFSFLMVLWAICRMYTGQVAIYIALVGLFLGIFGLLFFGFGVITTQNIKVLKELWKIRK